MKAAIIGCGFSGQVHAAALRACGVEIAAVVSVDEQAVRRFAEQWNIPVFGTSQELAFADEIDVVHICTPPNTHGQIVRDMLSHKKHVLCEKPLSLDEKEAAELADLADASGLVCALTFNVRYHMACARAKEILDSGELGRVLMIHGNYMQEFHALPAPMDWRYNETLAGTMRAVSEIGSHWLDLASYLTGLRAEAVSATFGCFHPQRVLKDGMMYPVHQGVEGTPVAVHTEDAAAVTIRYENGVLGNVLLSEVSPGRGNRLTIEITCENGNLWWNEEDNNLLHTARKGQGVHTEVFAFGNGFSDTFQALVREMYEVIQGKASAKSTYPTFAQGAQTAAVCRAVYDSAKNDSRWTWVERQGEA